MTGPVAGVYLDTSRDIDDPDRAVELRWRQLRRALEAEGADSATLAALEGMVGADREVDGRHGQALFAAGGEPVLARVLPRPPGRDTARYGRTPDAMPLAVRHAPDIAYLAVLIGRERLPESGSREPAATASPDEEDTVVAYLQAGRWPMSAVAPRPVASYGFPVDQWQRAAGRVTDAAGELARVHHAEVVVVWAQRDDAWSRGVFVNRLSPGLRDRLITVEGETLPHAAPGRALLEERLASLLDGRLGERDRAQVDRYLAQRARDAEASEGLAATVGAAQRGQVQALLVNEEHGLAARRLWAGPGPGQLALSREELDAFGVPSAHEEPADSLLVRAAVGTGAELIVVPSEEVSLADGTGVLLRYGAVTP
ncbi:hypothetical protein [Streptomyces sp. NPDC057877]|uniref:baeRF2 domain-containing protein n=1 Tax=Streptomyces sp. NPDC057877 TaxID=3346269 RepID=UPI00369305E4